MKIGLFSDAHYSSAASTGIRLNNQSLRKIREAYACFAKQGCELVICLGDLIDTEQSPAKEAENLAKVGTVIRESGIPTVCVMGNHDAFAMEPAQFYEILGIPAVEELCLSGKRLLFLDACYFRDGRRYTPGDVDWTDTFYPCAERLAECLRHGEEETYLFVHQNLDPAVERHHRIANADAIMALIRETRVVKAVYQGHYHPGCCSEYDGVRYITLPAMCEGEGAFTVVDL